METKLSAVLKAISEWSLYAIVFLSPLFFSPLTLDSLELPKYFLFYFLVILSLICFLGRGVARKFFELRRTPLDMPLLMLWVVFLISSIISKAPFYSFFGDYSYLQLSFVGLSAFIIFYFLIAQLIVSLKQVWGLLFALLAGGALSALFFVLKAWGLLRLPGSLSALSNPTETSITLFGMFLVIIFIVALGLLTIKKKNILLDVISVIAAIICAAALIVSGFALVWKILCVALFISLVLALTHIDYIRTAVTSLLFVFFVASLLFVLLGFPRFLTAKLPTEVSLAPRPSWSIATKAVLSGAKNFIFGSGPSTFVYSFSAYRPPELNNSSAWNVRFREPYNGAFEWFATMGLLGALALLVVILMILGLALSAWVKQFSELRRKKRGGFGISTANYFDSPLLFWTILGAWLTLFISFFFSNFGFVQWMLFWLMAGLMAPASAHFSSRQVKIQSISLKSTPQYALLTSFGFTLVFTAILVLGVFLGRFAVAEAYYKQAMSLPPDARIATLQKAIVLNANRVPLYLALADTVILQAGATYQKTGDLGQATAIVATAVNTAKIATDKYPNDAAAWEYLAAMYATARPFAVEANNWAVSSFEKAIALEPTNPTYYVGLGEANLIDRKYSSAKENYEKAIALKPDLTLTYLQLAALAETQKDFDGAIAAVERGLSYGQQDHVYVFQLGRYYYNRNQKNDLAMAELAFRRAVVLNPSYSDALYALGLLYEKKGDLAQAKSFYQKVLDLNPGNDAVKKQIERLNGAAAVGENTSVKK